MMNHEQALEAAAEIVCVSTNEGQMPDFWFKDNFSCLAGETLTTALRVTGADELADFLAEALAHFENGTIPLDSMIENMQAALGRYTELKNG